MFVRRIYQMSTMKEIKDGRLHVPTFYAFEIAHSNSEGLNLPFISTAIIATTFGAIHCAGWFFTFHTKIEAITWRVCCAIITGVPLTMSLTRVGNMLANRWQIEWFRDPFQVTVLVYITVLIYVLARLGLLVLALISLRGLPPGAYYVVSWDSFIPHI